MPDGPALTGRSARGRWLRAFVASIVSLLSAAQAEAQGGRGATAPGEFDFYVLALSWSPGFCALEGERRGLDQCRPGSGLGFVVHGLWPQFERGFPSECSAFERPPTREAIQSVADLFPSESLARHEWRRHGTCSGKGPAGYFADVRRAREAVRVPEELSRPGSERRATPRDVERAFVEANPGLRADMLAVACRRGVLQEVRVCFTKDLRGFRSCPEVDRSGCRGDEITVPGAP